MASSKMESFMDSVEPFSTGNYNQSYLKNRHNTCNPTLQHHTIKDCFMEKNVFIVKIQNLLKQSNVLMVRSDYFIFII